MIFASLARPHEGVHVQIVGDFLQTKLDSEINAPFLLNEYGDAHFLFYKFNENNMLNKGLYGGGGGGGGRPEHFEMWWLENTCAKTVD